MEAKELAKEMYYAYGQRAEFKNYAGNPMPLWHMLPEKQQDCWTAAAEHAIQRLKQKD